MNVAELGNAIADEIEKRGHWKRRPGAVLTENGPTCIVLSNAYGEVEEMPSIVGPFLEKVIANSGGNMTGDHWVEVTRFNDSHSKEEVVEVLRNL